MRPIDADLFKKGLEDEADSHGYDDQDSYDMGVYNTYMNVIDLLDEQPTAEPETSRIERELHGKTPEEQCEFLYWLLLNFGLTYTDSRLAVIEWLKGEQNE